MKHGVLFSRIVRSGAMFIAVAAAAGALTLCQSASKVSGGEEIEGWRLQNEEDYFYMRIAGRATDNALEKSTFAMLKQSCIESTKNQASDVIIRKMIGESITGGSTTIDGQTQSAIISSVRQGMIRGVEMKECAPRGKDGEWSECECIHFVHGKDLKKKFQLKIQESSSN